MENVSDFLQGSVAAGALTAEGLSVCNEQPIAVIRIILRKIKV